MSTDVKITYVNNSGNTDKPSIFVFTKNLVPTFDVLKDGVAWRVMPDIGKGSSSCFVYPIITTVQAMWGDCNKTRTLDATIGKRYTVLEDDTGIVLVPNGDASQSTAIEVNSLVQVDGGIRAQLCKDGKVMMTKQIVAYDQKATFILHPKLYWGIASEIQEGQLISSAVLNTDNFFEQDIEGVLEAVVTLTGNAKEGYQFYVENKA
ncbi:MAG: hypothetical protein PVH61_06985 [Candidatus Aminicenantes bacterium]|jgi:hypothetical protein